MPLGCPVTAGQDWSPEIGRHSTRGARAQTREKRRGWRDLDRSRSTESRPTDVILNQIVTLSSYAPETTLLWGRQASEG